MGVLSDIIAGFAILFAGKTPTDTLPPSLSYEGKTVLVTGATSGLGLETAIHYVNLRAFKVIITARTHQKGEKAKTEIEKRTGKKDVIYVMVLNMDEFEGVVHFVKELENTVSRIDIVLLNAGIHDFEYKLSPDGWVSVLQVNTLSTMLLGLLLLPWLRKTKIKGQIQHLGFTSSSSHFVPDISQWPKKDILEFANREEEFRTGFHIYETSKLLLQYSIQEFAALVTSSSGTPDPIVNSVCPGRIRSNIAHSFTDNNRLLVPVLKLWQFIGSNPTDIGARSLVMLGDTKAEEHGTFKFPDMTQQEYVKKTMPVMGSEKAKMMQKQVWMEICKVLVDAAPEVKHIIGGYSKD